MLIKIKFFDRDREPIDVGPPLKPGSIGRPLCSIVGLLSSAHPRSRRRDSNPERSVSCAN
ncbi:unnamed protein product, partial [Schistosoma intercalatum]